MKIGIIGSGVVGYAVGKGFSNLSHDVLFYDINNDILNKIKKEGFQTTNNLKLIADFSEIFFICLPTPTKNNKADISILKSFSKNLSKLLKNKKDYFLLVIKSTILPMTTERLIPLIERYSNKKVGIDFGICFNPEFLRQNNAYEDFMNPDRIVIGEYDKKSGDLLENIYKNFKCPIIRTNLRTSEIVKYANNCFYAAKISFFNEFHLICRKLGIDSEILRRIVQLDKFYSNHPWSHGKSFGGACISKDLQAFITFCTKDIKVSPEILKAVKKINEEMKKYS